MVARTLAARLLFRTFIRTTRLAISKVFNSHAVKTLSARTNSSSPPYNFLQESHRWKDRIVDAHDAKIRGIVIPLTTQEWDAMMERISSAQLKSWLNHQRKGRLACILPSSTFTGEIEKALDMDMALDEEKELILLRLSQDSKPSEGGLQSPMNLLKPLAEASNAGVNEDAATTSCYQVMLPPPTSQLDHGSVFQSLIQQSYTFDRYKSSKQDGNGDKNKPLRVLVPNFDNNEEANVLATATYWCQDLISTPANDLTPGALQEAVQDWAEQQQEYSDSLSVEAIVGQDLLSYNGALSTRPTSLNDCTKHVALVGKGVTYDTGGLNLKPGASMKNMKKDMGGAAVALGLARALVETKANLKLDVWIPTVENVVDSDSYRPGDILTAVNGKTTEIGNTDAEGRLILADALALASAEEPDLIVDFATLTGAARVALGTELPALVSNNPAIAQGVLQAAVSERDPLWQLPLWEGYRERIKSKIADLQNIPSDGLGGAITAALYLNQFVDNERDWVHLDLYGMDAKTNLGRAQGLRAFYRFLKDEYCQ